jgi:hypothetical protein
MVWELNLNVKLGVDGVDGAEDRREVSWSERMSFLSVESSSRIVFTSIVPAGGGFASFKTRICSLSISNSVRIARMWPGSPVSSASLLDLSLKTSISAFSD